MEFHKNDIVTTKITDIGSDGEGIGRADGFTLFVKDAVVGDTVEARIVKMKKNYAYARMEKVVEPSPFRVEPRCAYHRQCGGCQLQALSYEKQLAFKQERIRSSLIHIGGFLPEDVDKWMEPIIGMEDPFRYRNKAQYPVGTDREGRLVTGFYAGRTHSIIANTECLLGPEENRQILECILDYMRRNKVSAYNETDGTGLVRHVLIRKGFSSGEIMVCLVLNSGAGTQDGGQPSGKGVVRGRGAAGKGPGVSGSRVSCASALSAERSRRQAERFLPYQEDLVSGLKEIKGMTSISVSLNNARTNVIMGNEIYTIWGRDTISDTIHARDMKQAGYPFTGEELTFHISPLSFYQVNPAQTEKLYSLVLEYASLTGQEIVWDLYCGIGTISLFLARSARKVYGVEVVPQAVEDARQNALRNGITNAEFLVGKVEEAVSEFSGETGREGGSGAHLHSRDVEGRDTDGRDVDGRDMDSRDVKGRDTDGRDVDSRDAYSGDVEAGRKKMLPPDVIVVDPPRKGCDEACLDAILEMKPDRIVYVSCDPATLARDLKKLCGGGYEVERVRGLDQFGMSVHVETVCLLSNRKSKPDTHVQLSLSMDDY